MSNHRAVSYVCIALTMLIYSSIPFTIPKFIQFIRSVFIHNTNEDPFFQNRQPVITTVYISLFIFILYIIYPLVLILMIWNISNIPIYINDIANIFIFVSFFIRSWILVFDRYFHDHLNNWIWRKELNAKERETNTLVKYSHIIKSKSSIMFISFSILCLVPLFAVFIILSYIYYPYFRLIYSLILSILLLFTLYLIKTKICIATDEYDIRSELLYTFKSAGTLYAASGVLYTLLVYTVPVPSELAVNAEILFISLGHLCTIYYCCYWTTKQFKILNASSSALNASNSFISVFNDAHNVQFSDIMDHRIGFEVFCSHLVEEFSLESILFIIESSQFKAKVHDICKRRNIKPNSNIHQSQIPLPTTQSTIFCVQNILNINWMPMNPNMLLHSPYKVALYLYDRYIESSADLCINISSSDRRNIYKAFKELAVKIPDQNLESDESVLNILYTLFDKATTEIWHLLEHDSFFRFRSTLSFERVLLALYTKTSKKAIKDIDSDTKTSTQKHNDKADIQRVPSDSVVPKSEQKEIENTKAMIDFMDTELEQKYDLPRSTSNHVGDRFCSLPSSITSSLRSKSADLRAINLDHLNDLLNEVTVPADIIKTAADFWSLNINSLSEDDKLELGVAIYLSMLAVGRSIRHLFQKQKRIKQEQIKTLSLKFLDMICFLIQLLWLRNDTDLNRTLSKLGSLHKNIHIQIAHFNVMLDAIHEQFKFYFPVNYRLQEQYAMDYIFAFSSEIMMNQSLSTNTKNTTYYKTLEMKFYSEKYKNDALNPNNNSSPIYGFTNVQNTKTLTILFPSQGTSLKKVADSNVEYHLV